jgi:hypothetical protein
MEILAETGTCYSSSSSSDDDDYLPTVEKILYPTLQKKNSTIINISLNDIILGIEKLISEERNNIINYNRLILGKNLNKNLNKYIYYFLL